MKIKRDVVRQKLMELLNDPRSTPSDIHNALRLIAQMEGYTRKPIRRSANKDTVADRVDEKLTTFDKQFEEKMDRLKKIVGGKNGHQKDAA